MNEPPACLDCRTGDRDHPCRPAGRFDPAVLGKAYFENVIRDASETGQGGAHWSYDCLYDLRETAPDAAWATILDLLARLETRSDAASLAAGPLEDLIADQGPDVIDRIEALARRSARFRLVLTGVWPQRKQGTPVWRRIEAARRHGPTLDDDAAALPES